MNKKAIHPNDRHFWAITAPCVDGKGLLVFQWTFATSASKAWRIYIKGHIFGNPNYKTSLAEGKRAKRIRLMPEVGK